jgi:UPF0271 protein
MSIAGRFEEALTSVTETGLDGPELLPTRLSRAIARMLPVDGAGISLAGPDGQRIPLGASSVPAAVAERAVRMAAEGVVVAVDGTAVDVAVDSVCVHGDTPGAVELARGLRAALESAGLEIAAFAR